jgi:hypothetical protein
MRRTRIVITTLGALSLSAGLAAAHAMPAASDGGIHTAREASGKLVPLGDGSLTSPDATTATPDVVGAPPEGTHGAVVSAAAKAPTPTDGGFANHGAYVSSIAKGWGQATSAAHRNGNASGRPVGLPPTAATNGLTHQP